MNLDLVSLTANPASGRKSTRECTIPPSKDAESAMSLTLVPGAYTAIVRGMNDTAGVAADRSL